MNQTPVRRNNDIELSVIIPYSQAQQFDPAEELYCAYQEMLESTGLNYEVIYIIDGAREVFQKEKISRENCILKKLEFLQKQRKGYYESKSNSSWKHAKLYLCS